MLTNRAKQRLQAGHTVFGCFLRFPQAGLAELLALQEWDLLVADAEHGVIEPADVENIVRAAERHEVPCLVRVPPVEPALLGRILDTGAAGVHVPTVRSAAHAAAIVRHVKYHPLGERGLAAVRAAMFAQREPLAKYIGHANDQTMIVAHIESADALEDLRGICRTDHIDVIFIGPTDLAHSLGVPGEMNHARVQDAMNRITQETLSAGKVLGVAVSDAESTMAWHRKGARYLTVTMEAMIRSSCQSYLQRVREAAKQAQP
jgi:4-hydroxy-2-oxoheptanedioate aldolase